jgi:hypothetical protein
MANTLCSNRHILVAPESSRIHYFYGKLSQVKNLLIVLKITSPTAHNDASARFCKALNKPKQALVGSKKYYL